MLHHSLINSRAQCGIIDWGSAASYLLQPIGQPFIQNCAMRCLNTNELVTNKISIIYEMQRII